jgi:hypothetical protein
MNDGNQYVNGQVRVYQWNSGSESWEQKGQDIDGEAKNDFSGYSVSISADGNTIAIGAYLNDRNGSNSGQTRVFQWNGSSNSWEQKGQDIDGEANGDWSGWSVSFSSDGNTVAIGATYNNGNVFYNGHVRVY